MPLVHPKWSCLFRRQKPGQVPVHCANAGWRFCLTAIPRMNTPAQWCSIALNIAYSTKSRTLPATFTRPHTPAIKHCRKQLCSQSLHSTIIDTTILSTTLERSQSEVTKGYDRTHHIQVWFPKSLLLMLLPPTITLLAASTMMQLQLQHPALFQSQRNTFVHWHSNYSNILSWHDGAIHLNEMQSWNG